MNFNLQSALNKSMAQVIELNIFSEACQKNELLQSQPRQTHKLSNHDASKVTNSSLQVKSRICSYFVITIQIDNKIDAAKKRYRKFDSDWATFNIRKVQRKGTFKPTEEIGLFTPQFQFEKYPEAPTYTNPKKEKELMIDYSVNEAILNSKAYCDLKNIYNENKVKNSQTKRMLQDEVQRLKKEKEEALAEEQRLQNQTKKYEQLLAGLKERIISTRQKNRQTRQFLQSRMNNEAEYLSNIILSMRFQAEYYHDIDPDQMSYEQLLQLQQKIGSVCKGLPLEVIEKLPSKKLQENIDDKCTICFCGLEAEETVIILPPCQHKFHDGCLKQWLAKEKICPLCKRQVQIK